MAVTEVIIRCDRCHATKETVRLQNGGSVGFSGTSQRSPCPTCQPKHFGTEYQVIASRSPVEGDASVTPATRAKRRLTHNDLAALCRGAVTENNFLDHAIYAFASFRSGPTNRSDAEIQRSFQRFLARRLAGDIR